MMNELQQKETDNQDRSRVKKIPQENIIPKDSNKSWLTLFYSLPKEFVSKRPAFLDLPRCPYEVLRTDKYDSLINTDVFLETVWDSTAWSIWQYLEVPYKDGSGYREIPGSTAQYSGDFPLWRLSYTMLPLLRDKYATCGFSFQQLANVPRGTDIPWLTYEQFGNLIGGLVPEIVSEQDWQPMIDAIWNNRTAEDFDKRGSQVKLDFMRSWEHSRSKKKTVSLEQLTEEAEEKDGGFEIPDTPYIFNAIDAATKLVLGHLAIEEKTNEITAIPQLLELLEIKDNVFTIDAIGTQTKIMEKITEDGGHFVLQVKKNQPTMYDDILTGFESHEKGAAKGEKDPRDGKQEEEKYSSWNSVEKNRERIEYRECHACSDAEFLECVREGETPYIKSVGYITQVRVPIEKNADGEDITVSKEEFIRKGSHRKPIIIEGDGIRDDIQHVGIISDMKLDAEKMAKYKRDHWRIENNLHHVLDDVFREDRSTATKSKNNLAVIRKAAYNLLRLAIIMEQPEWGVQRMMDYFCDSHEMLGKYVFSGI